LLPETRTFDGATNLREEARARTTPTQSVVRPFSSTTTTKEKG